jgi:hypothetical protein
VNEARDDKASDYFLLRCWHKRRKKRGEREGSNSDGI